MLEHSNKTQIEDEKETSTKKNLIDARARIATINTTDIAMKVKVVRPFLFFRKYKIRIKHKHNVHNIHIAITCARTHNRCDILCLDSHRIVGLRLAIYAK